MNAGSAADAGLGEPPPADQRPADLSHFGLRHEGVQLAELRWWDIPELVALECELFPVDPWSAAQFWGELARVGQSRYYVLARDTVGVAGYAGLYLVDSHADVQTVAVAPRAQRRGLGRVLMGELIRVADGQGVRELHLEVRADNLAAAALYRGFGFRDVGVRRDYYGRGNHALLMTLELPTPGSMTPGLSAASAVSGSVARPLPAASTPTVSDDGGAADHDAPVDEGRADG